jgi:tetratricopeptide (TPR) repeat protein
MNFYQELSRAQLGINSPGSAYRSASKAIRIATASNLALSTNLQQVYFNAAQALIKSGRNAAAQSILLEVCDKAKSQFGKNSFEYSRANHRLADLYAMSGELTKSINLYEDLLVTYRKTLLETDPMFIELLNSLAEAYQRSHQPHRAYVYLRWAYEVLHASTKNIEMLAVDVNTNLATVYASKGDNESASQHYAEAKEFQSRMRH